MYFNPKRKIFFPPCKSITLTTMQRSKRKIPAGMPKHGRKRRALTKRGRARLRKKNPPKMLLKAYELKKKGKIKGCYSGISKGKQPKSCPKRVRQVYNKYNIRQLRAKASKVRGHSYLTKLGLASLFAKKMATTKEKRKRAARRRKESPVY